MFKNLFTPDEYDIKRTPYKLRGSFLSKAAKLEQSLSDKPKEETPAQKLARLEEELKTLDAAIDAKKEDIARLEQQFEDTKIRTEAEIASMLAEAEKTADELKAKKEKEGYEAGFDKGYYEGLEKGKAEMDQKYSALITTMQSITEAALAEKHKIIKNTEDDIVNLSVDIAKKVVDQELSVKKDIVVNFVKEAIKMLENKEKITIFAHPEDMELIKSHRDDFKKLTDLTDTMKILPDDMLERGECRLESQSEIVDTDINYQFGEIKKKLHTSE